MHGKIFFVHFFITKLLKANLASDRAKIRKSCEKGERFLAGIARLGLTGFIVLCVVGPLGKGGWRTKFF